MRRSHLLAGLVLATSLATAITVLTAVNASAAENNGRVRTTIGIAGFRGEHNIRTDPATVNGVGYVHAMQLGFDPSDDFLAIGTAKGVGAGGGGCPDRYGDRWEIYTDGMKNGLYFCNEESLNAYTAGNIPPFSIYPAVCPNGLNGWNLNMGGTTWSCKTQGGGIDTTGDIVAGTLETTGASNVDRNIDVRYRDMEFRSFGTWKDFGVGVNVAQPNYQVGNITSQRFDVFLPPLD